MSLIITLMDSIYSMDGRLLRTWRGGKVCVLSSVGLRRSRPPSTTMWRGSMRRGDEERMMEESATLIDTMTREMLQELFVGSAVNYVTEGEALHDEVSGMLERVVGPRIDEMPAAVLPMIDAYLEALDGHGDNGETARILHLIKGFVLERLEDTLPEPMKCLQEVMDANRDDRLQKYQEIAERGESMLLDAYKACAGLIQTLEDEDEIADLRFLSKLCLIKCEMDSIIPPDDLKGVVRNRFTEIGGVLEYDSGFLKELLHVQDSMKRISLIKMSIEKVGEKSIRPGRFLDCIAAVQKEMLEKQGDSDDQAVYHRIQDVAHETKKVLEELSGDLPLMP